ncbi:MAG: hypothetical protein AAGD07_17035, partial [Planctomycetota bacterium]
MADLGLRSPLSVQFDWTGDRYRHQVDCSGSLGSQSVSWCYQSVDRSDGKVGAFTATDDWPTSPVLQQLSMESIQGMPTLMGVGCCGTSHFSVSVQFRSWGDSLVLWFDWACRLSQDLGSTSDVSSSVPLGSTYERRGGEGFPGVV